jgi:hypothetical protein
MSSDATKRHHHDATWVSSQRRSKEALEVHAVGRTLEAPMVRAARHADLSPSSIARELPGGRWDRGNRAGCAAESLMTHHADSMLNSPGSCVP